MIREQIIDVVKQGVRGQPDRTVFLSWPCEHSRQNWLSCTMTLHCTTLDKITIRHVWCFFPLIFWVGNCDIVWSIKNNPCIKQLLLKDRVKDHVLFEYQHSATNGFIYIGKVQYGTFGFPMTPLFPFCFMGVLSKCNHQDNILGWWAEVLISLLEFLGLIRQAPVVGCLFLTQSLQSTHTKLKLTGVIKFLRYFNCCHIYSMNIHTRHYKFLQKSFHQREICYVNSFF